MPKFCYKCGTEIKFQDAKFCSECGATFNESAEPKKDIVEVTAGMDEVQPNTQMEINSGDIIELQPTLSYKELGNKLEAFTAKILEADGWEVEKNKWDHLKSGTRAEFDIIATKKQKDRSLIRIVECKNYKTSVPRKEIDAFIGKSQSHSVVKNPNLLFVSISFTQDARQQAQEHNITLWDRDDLKEKLFGIEIGRFGQQTKEITFPYALSLLVDYNKITVLELENADKVTINSAKLFWRPFYKINYSLYITKADPAGKSHSIKDEGICFVDAQDGTVLNLPTPKENDTLFDIFPDIKFKDSEEDLFLKELKNEPEHDYRISESNEYQVIKIDYKISKHIAKENAIKSIIYTNTKSFDYEVKSKKRRNDDSDFPEVRDFTIVPKKGDITIKETQVVHVPKWDIEFISGDQIYRREIIGHKGTIISDPIQYCPKHKIIGLEIFKKNTIALCEIDGKALCKDHVFQCPTCKKWNCEEHSINCSTCGTHYCKEHLIAKCSDCESLVCDLCSLKCPICGQIHCKKHWVKCDKCNTEVCISCTTTKSSMLVFKKYICKKCQS